MAKLKVEKMSGLDSLTAYAKVKDFIQNDDGLRKLDQHYKCTFDDEKRQCDAKGQQFHAILTVHATDSGSRVDVEVEVPFALSLFKGKIQEILQRKLDKTLG